MCEDGVNMRFSILFAGLAIVTTQALAK